MASKTFVITLSLMSVVLALPPPVDQFSKASNDFATELYQRTVEDKAGNVIFSPVSIQSALSLTMFGASGSNKEEMKAGLKFPADYTHEDIAKSFKGFTKKVRSTEGLKVANKVYVKNGYSVKKSFNDVATKSFASEAQTLDFSQNVAAAKEINAWVESNTNNKIKDLISAESLDGDTRMVLVNAIYFKGLWANQFDPKNTIKAPFYLNEQDSVQHDFMKVRSHFKIGNFGDLDASAIELPYKDSGISMFIILPNARTGLSALEEKFNTIDLEQFSSKLHPQEAFVEIPKFKIEFDIELNEPLEKMGMQQMFHSDSGFIELLEQRVPLTVTKVVHKAFIEVNEEGAEAAGATGVVISTRSGRGPIFFVANRSFIFMLRQGSTTLFMGRVVRFD